MPTADRSDGSASGSSEDGGARLPLRDDVALAAAERRGVGRAQMAPALTGDQRAAAWGGALRRMADAGVLPSREDEYRFVAVPGRYVPVGYGRYVSPQVDPRDYEFYRVAGWRVAVPRAIPGEQVRTLLRSIHYYGPQSVGYVRVKDTLVPAILPVGDRTTIAESAIEYEPYPLSP